MIIAQTERLLIRQIHLFDHAALRQIFCDPEVMHFGDGVQTDAWIQDWIATCLRRYALEWGFGPYAVVERDRSMLIGYCGLFFFPDVNGRPEVELGYRLARAAWGRGYATEAAAAVRDYAFQTLGIRRLIAMIDPQNLASVRVAEKLGMTYEAEVMFDGYTHPDHVYAL